MNVIRQDNEDLMSRVLLWPLLSRICHTLYQEELELADLGTDITRAEAALDTETQEVIMLQGNVAKIADAQKANADTLAASTQTIADLNKEVEALKTANPGIDTTALEAKVAQAEQNNITLDSQNRTLAALIPAAPASA